MQSFVLPSLILRLTVYSLCSAGHLYSSAVVITFLVRTSGPCCFQLALKAGVFPVLLTLSFLVPRKKVFLWLDPNVTEAFRGF